MLHSEEILLPLTENRDDTPARTLDERTRMSKDLSPPNIGTAQGLDGAWGFEIEPNS